MTSWGSRTMVVEEAATIVLPFTVAAAYGMAYMPDPNARLLLASMGAGIGVCLVGINRVGRHGSGPEGSTKEA